jgi:hypothetical protein
VAGCVHNGSHDCGCLICLAVYTRMELTACVALAKIGELEVNTNSVSVARDSVLRTDYVSLAFQSKEAPSNSKMIAC